MVFRALSEKCMGVCSRSVPVLFTSAERALKCCPRHRKDFSMEAAVLNSASARNESCYSQLFQQRYHLRMLAA